MNICLENVNLNSNSGPNYFAQKLVKYMEIRGTTFETSLPYDVRLAFIESHHRDPNIPMVQRLDGIYFNANFDCDKMNYNIRRTYEAATGVVFQTNFNKNLIFNWFGPHDNYRIINNGSDLLQIKGLQEDENIRRRFQNFDNVWSCAAHWHRFKRLDENIQYFLNFSKKNDCLVIAGSAAVNTIKHPRIFYVGNLDTNQLLTLFKISKYFIHLAYLDHCPNVVIDARSSGCQIICSSSGGTKEIAGSNAIVVKEEEWDYSFLEDAEPPDLDYGSKINTGVDSELSMLKVSKKYLQFLNKVYHEFS